MSELKMLGFKDLERVQANNRTPLFLNALQMPGIDVGSDWLTHVLVAPWQNPLMDFASKMSQVLSTLRRKMSQSI